MRIHWPYEGKSEWRWYTAQAVVEKALGLNLSYDPRSKRVYLLGANGQDYGFWDFGEFGELEAFVAICQVVLDYTTENTLRDFDNSMLLLRLFANQHISLTYEIIQTWHKLNGIINKREV